LNLVNDVNLVWLRRSFWLLGKVLGRFQVFGRNEGRWLRLFLVGVL